jgi:hypothetical protein
MNKATSFDYDSYGNSEFYTRVNSNPQCWFRHNGNPTNHTNYIKIKAPNYPLYPSNSQVADLVS